MSETEQLLLSIGASLGRSPEQMAPIVHKLVEEEWYDSLESLRAISDAKWTALNLPQRLVEEIRRRIEMPPQLVPIPPSQPPTRIIAAESRDSGWTVEIAPTCVSSVSVGDLIESLQVETRDDLSAYLACLSTLCQIATNILSDPKEVKFRQLKASNVKFAANVARWNSARLLMTEMGFTATDNGSISCPVVYLSRLTDMHALLGMAIEATGLAPRPVLTAGTFNPFQASIVNAGNTFGAGSTELVKERESERNGLIEDLRAKAAVPETSSFPKLVRTAPLPEKKASVFSKLKKKGKKEAVTEDEDESILLSNLRSVISGNDTKFKSREKTEMEKLRTRPVFNTCTIRIIFLDNCYLEFSVKPSETIAGVYAVVDQCVDHYDKWTLTVTPPLRKLDRNSRQTMNQEGFVPSVTMRMMDDGKQCSAANVLKKEYLN